MAKKRGLVMYAEYYGFRILFMVFRAMPIDAALLLARLISPVVYLLHRRHRLVAYDNLRKAYGNKLTEREIRRITRGVYANLVMTGVEVLRMGDILRPDTWHKYIHVENKHIVEKVAASGKGAIFVAAHLGNWELCGFVAMRLLGDPLHAISRPFDNPLLDEYANTVSSRRGHHVIGRKGAMRAFVRTLRENKFLGMIVDQDARDQGIFVEFFGRQSSWTPSPAVLALRFDVPIIPAFSRRRENRFRYDVFFGEPITPQKTGNDREEVHRMVADYAKRIEDRVRLHPEDWLWNHRRWKTRPPEEIESQEAKPAPS